MGGALLEGWLAATGDSVVVIEPEAAALSAWRGRPRVSLHAMLDEVPAGFAPEVVVFATKPQVMAALVPAYRRFATAESFFLSIAAGRTLGFFASHLGEAAVVRSMPNTPAAIGRGMTVAVANPRVTEAQRARSTALLGAVGEVAWVGDEALLDPVTAVSGSGPAYVFLLVESLAAAGVAAGLPADLAQRLARATVEGSGELLRQAPGMAPEQLRRNVTSPGGTTQAALDVLMAEDGLRTLMTRAVAAATRRSRELAG